MEKTMCQPVFSNVDIVRSPSIYDLNEFYEKENIASLENQNASNEMHAIDKIDERKQENVGEK
jgi:hypothetical protein